MQPQYNNYGRYCNYTAIFVYMENSCVQHQADSYDCEDEEENGEQEGGMGNGKGDNDSQDRMENSEQEGS